MKASDLSTKMLNVCPYVLLVMLASCKYEPVNTTESSNEASKGNENTQTIALPECEGECSCDELVNPFNDTGVRFAGDFPSGNFANCDNQSDFLQDCDHGRDRVQTDDSDGHGGFNFTKINREGDVVLEQADQWHCVQDNTTGLIWEVKAISGSGELQDSAFTYSWYDQQFPEYSEQDGGNCDYDCDSSSYINRLNASQLCGFSDWRLPNKVELQDLINYHDFKPSIDTVFFPNTQSSFYWTNTMDTDDVGSVWSVDFDAGRVAGVSSQNAHYIRAVRGESLIATNTIPTVEGEFDSVIRNQFAAQQRCQDINQYSSPVNRYKQDSQGNVLDTVTGLIWQKCVVGLSGANCETGEAEKLDWQQAFEYAKTQSELLTNSNPWRVPTIKELQQNIEIACEEPPLNPIAFPNVPLDEVWSSTPHPRVDNASYHYQYQNSIIFYSDRAIRNHVHLVRDCYAF